MDNELVKQLALVRRTKSDIRDLMKSIVATVTSTPDYKQLETAMMEAVALEADALQSVHDAGISEYEQTGDKHPHEAVTVKLYTITEVTDPVAAREWCFKDYHPALVVDDKVLANAAKDGLVPAELVKVDTELRVTVAQDLSKYIE